MSHSNEPANHLPESRLSGVLGVGIYIGHTTDCTECHCKTVENIPKEQWDPTGVWASRIGKEYIVTWSGASEDLVQMLPEDWESGSSEDGGRGFFAYRSHVRILP